MYSRLLPISIKDKSEYIMNLLKKDIPKVSIILVSILFITNILTLYIPVLGNALMFYPSNLTKPFNWYRLLTYPLYVSGLFVWITNSIIILATGYIIESRLNKKQVIGLIILSSIIGGIGFAIMNFNDIKNVSLVSPVMISWGYWSVTIVVGLKCWKEFKIFEKIITVLCLISTIAIWDVQIGLVVGKVSVVLVTMSLVLMKHKKKLIEK